MLLSASTAVESDTSSLDDDFALKLYWGRQRGIAVIFATDAIECARRCAKSFLSTAPYLCLDPILHLKC